MNRSAEVRRPGGSYDSHRGDPGRQPGRPGEMSHYDRMQPSHGFPDHRYPGSPGFHNPSYANWYHGDWHDHWARPWYCGPAAWVSVGFVTGAVVWDAPWYWGYWPYYNPYSTEVIVVERTVIDYSQPIVVAAPAAPETKTGGAEIMDPASTDKESVRLLDASRDAFVKADYQAAMALINQAIARKPNDPVLHEVRALVLFARGQYSPAAAAIFAVLSVGPGWDSATLGGFYPNAAVYSDQLRALEQHCSGHANQPEVHFLLAYHYMVGGRIEGAAAEFQEAMRLNPKDQLSPQLLAGLSKQASGNDAAPVQASAPLPSVDRASLGGAWTASRSDGAVITLDISEDASFCWKYTQQGKLQQEFRGTYTVADNFLILKCSGNPTLIGQVALVDGGRFNFKLVGSSATDPGLTFTPRDAEHTAQTPQAPLPEVRR